MRSVGTDDSGWPTRWVRRAAVLGVAVLAACADDSGSGPSARGEGAPGTVAVAMDGAVSDGPVAPTTAPEVPSLATAAPAPGPQAASGIELRWNGRAAEFTHDPDTGTSNGSLPVRLVALERSFDVVVTRGSYDDPIEAVVRRGEFGAEVPLPTGTVTDWFGLPGFFEIVARDGTGAELDTRTGDFCPSSTKERAAPGGPLLDPYPSGCYGNAFTLGTVWGVAAGWSAEVDTYAELALAPGTYELELRVAEPYASALGDIAPVSFPVEVIDPPPSERRDLDADGVDDADDPLIDADADGVDDTVDEAVDGDLDGLDDYYEDPYVDLDGDGFDDFSGVTEAEALAGGDAAPTDPGEPVDAGDDDAHDGAPTAPAHEGRPTTTARPDDATLPDLVPLPALDIDAGYDEDTGRDLLSFAATTWNRGSAPLVVDGFRRPGTVLMDAYQQFFRRGREVGSEVIGTFEFHAGGGHDHWHFLDFSRYELVPEGGGAGVRSGKESWCLASTDPVDLTLPAAVWQPENSNLGTACGDESSGWVRETLPVGWGDTYTQYVAGQAIDITDVPNGRYLLRITANPDGNLFESDTSNNVADRLVVLGGEPGVRTVTVPPVGLVDSEGDEPFGFGAGALD